MGAIQNDTLKSQLAAFFALEEVAVANYDEIVGNWDELDRYVMEKFDYVEIVRAYHPEELTTVSTREWDPSELDVLGESEFRDWMGYKWHLSRDFLDRFEDLLAQANLILEILSEELEEPESSTAAK